MHLPVRIAIPRGKTYSAIVIAKGYRPIIADDGIDIVLNVVPIPQPDDQYPLLLVDDVLDHNSNAWTGTDGRKYDNDFYPDLDDTAVVLMVLDKLRGLGRAGLPSMPSSES